MIFSKYKVGSFATFFFGHISLFALFVLLCSLFLGTSYSNKAFANTYHIGDMINHDSNYVSTSFVNSSDQPHNLSNLNDSLRVGATAPWSGHGFSIIDELRDEGDQEAHKNKVRVVAFGYGDAFVFDESKNSWKLQGGQEYVIEKVINGQPNYYALTAVQSVKFYNRIYILRAVQDYRDIRLLEYALINGSLKKTKEYQIAKFVGGAAPGYSIAISENNKGEKYLVVYATDAAKAFLWVFEKCERSWCPNYIVTVGYLIKDWRWGDPPPVLWNVDLFCGGKVHDTGGSDGSDADGKACHKEISGVFSVKSETEDFYVGYLATSGWSIKLLKINKGSVASYVRSDWQRFISEDLIVNLGKSVLDAFRGADQPCDGDKYHSFVDAKILFDGSTGLNIDGYYTCPHGLYRSIRFVKVKYDSGRGVDFSWQTIVEWTKVGHDPGPDWKNKANLWIVGAGGLTEIVTSSGQNHGVVIGYSVCGPELGPKGGTGYHLATCPGGNYGFELAIENSSSGLWKKTVSLNSSVATGILYYSPTLERLFIGSRVPGVLGGTGSTYNLKGIWYISLIGPRCTLTVDSNMLSANNGVSVTIYGHYHNDDSLNFSVSRVDNPSSVYSIRIPFTVYSSNGYFTVSRFIDLKTIEDELGDLSDNPYSISLRASLPNGTVCKEGGSGGDGTDGGTGDGGGGGSSIIIIVTPYSKPEVRSVSLSCKNVKDPYALRFWFRVSPSNYPGASVKEILFIVGNANQDLRGYTFVYSRSVGTFSRPSNQYIYAQRIFASPGSQVNNNINSISSLYAANGDYYYDIDFTLDLQSFTNIGQISSYLSRVYYAIAVLDTSGRISLTEYSPVSGTGKGYSGYINFDAYELCNPEIFVSTSYGDVANLDHFSLELKKVSRSCNSISSSTNLTNGFVVGDFVYESVQSGVCPSTISLRRANLCSSSSTFLSGFGSVNTLIDRILADYPQDKILTINVSSTNYNYDVSSSRLQSKNVLFFDKSSNVGLLRVTVNDTTSVDQPLIVLCRGCASLHVNQNFNLPEPVFDSNKRLGILSNYAQAPKRIYVTDGEIYLGNDAGISNRNQIYIGGFISNGPVYTARSYKTTFVYGFVHASSVVSRGITDNLSGCSNSLLSFRYFKGRDQTQPVLHVSYDPWYRIWVDSSVDFGADDRSVILGL